MQAGSAVYAISNDMLARHAAVFLVITAQWPGHVTNSQTILCHSNLSNLEIFRNLVNLVIDS